MHPARCALAGGTARAMCAATVRPRAGRPAPTSPTSTPSRAAPCRVPRGGSSRRRNSRYRHHTQAAQAWGMRLACRAARREPGQRRHRRRTPTRRARFSMRNAGECCAQDMRLQVIRRASCSSGREAGCVPAKAAPRARAAVACDGFGSPQRRPTRPRPGPAWGANGRCALGAGHVRD